MAIYPSSIIAFTTKTNRVDLVDASHVNTLQEEVVAIETELGKSVKGTATDLVTRLRRSLATNGDVRNGTTFPVSEIGDGTPFYRTDEDTLYIYNGTAWQSTTSTSQLFSAYNSTNQTGITSATQINFDTEDFDTGSNFASSTYTVPSVGKYMFTVSLRLKSSNTGGSTHRILIYKNGSQYSVLTGGLMGVGNATNEYGASGSIVISLTTSDTIKIYAEIQDAGSSSNSLTIVHGSTASRFCGYRLTQG